MNFGFMQNLIKLIYLLAICILGNEKPDVSGSEKKKAVIEQFKKVEIDAKINLPAALVPLHDYVISLAIDMIVSYLNSIATYPSKS